MKRTIILIAMLLASSSLLLAYGLGLLELKIYAQWLPRYLLSNTYVQWIFPLALLILVSIPLFLLRAKREVKEYCFILQTRKGADVFWVKKAYTELTRVLEAITAKKGEATYTIEDSYDYGRLIIKSTPYSKTILEDKLRKLSYAITYTACNSGSSTADICYVKIDHDVQLLRVLQRYSLLDSSREVILVGWKKLIINTKMIPKNVKYFDISNLVSIEEKKARLEAILSNNIRTKNPIILIYNPIEMLSQENIVSLLNMFNRASKLKKQKIVILVDSREKADFNEIEECNTKSLRTLTQEIKKNGWHPP